MDFAELCRSRDLEIPDIEYTVPQLSDLVLRNDLYTIPVFAGFPAWTLPIVSYWIEERLGHYDIEIEILNRLSKLMPLIPCSSMITEHFIAMKTPELFKSQSAIGSIIRLLLHDHGRYAQYFSAENSRHLAGCATTVKQRTVAIVALGLLMERSEGQINDWLKEFVQCEPLGGFEFNCIFQQCILTADDRKILEESRASLAPIKDVDVTTQLKSSTFFACIGGLYVPRLGGNDENGTSYVETSNFLANTRAVAARLLTDQPLLLMGERGCGKTSIVEYIHQRVRNTELVRIHLGDQTDAKTLVGNYTTGALPGTFEWTPGALTSAVQRGQWVLIEDIDRAPNEIVSVLLSLLTQRELIIPSRNQVVRAAPGFQIIATTTAINTVDIIGQRSFAAINIISPTNEDLAALILAKRPFLSSLVAEMFVTVFRRVEEWQDRHNRNSSQRICTTRDLMRLVNRIGRHYTSEDMFREAVACFTSFMSEPLPLAKVIGEAMNIADSQVVPLLERFSPQINLTESRFAIGRAQLERRHVTSSAARNVDLELNDSKFALTQPTLKLMEEIAVGIEHEEPILLVGETGTGKTTVVQYLAKTARRKLIVINVSQQVETGDLVGGFKPVDARQLVGPSLDEFSELFDSTFSRAKNHQFLTVLEKTIAKQQWKNVVRLLREAVKMAMKANAVNTTQNSSPDSKRIRKDEKSDWSKFPAQIDVFAEKLEHLHQAAQFQFIEGLLVRALRQGHWILLDELNLAPADTVEGISESLSSRSLTMSENSGQVIHAHPQFRLFANMNPATDVGKRDLPMNVRSQFAEIWSPSPDSNIEALRAIIQRYSPAGADRTLVNDIAQLYINSRDLALKHQISDGAGQHPHFSIRTLTRMLVSASTISTMFGLRRALFETFAMSFLTLLDETSSETLMKEADKWLLERLPNRNSAMSVIPSVPKDGRHYVQFQHWWMPMSAAADPKDMERYQDPQYIITPSVQRNLSNLVRATALKSYPVLIQGPTSSGKTSMITYLAKRTAHTVIRINNHEHTDLAEYMGNYESDADGRLVFKEGALVRASRDGHWLILDELNLAPTDVLEALNRLLDDNRELLVPETQEIIKPHRDFVLFATQNPPGIYAGRKVLSRAFRNRFIELHFGDIPEQELEQIVRDRTGIAPSYAAKVVEVYRELGRRRIQRVFEQAATLRDLFRWAKRPAIGYEQLAFNGYCLLAERSRTSQEREAIKSVIEKVMRVTIDTDIASSADPAIMHAAPSQIVWTKAMRRVLALVQMALDQNEPVLLIGETGCGKTTIIQTLASARRQKLITSNAHQNTETGDLVGSQRPVRAHGSTQLFEWVDGPMVIASKQGSFFLLDEISLADDSVLERLNSVLEPERTLFVPELGSIKAESGFEFFSTMNPGGDYGKKESSPALRNRFTEIWVPTVEDDNDLKLIVSQRLNLKAHEGTPIIVNFSHWFSEVFGMVSLRDILSWVEFVNTMTNSQTTFELYNKMLVHGALMTFVDGLGVRVTIPISPDSVLRARTKCLEKLKELAGESAISAVDDAPVSLSNSSLLVGEFALPLRNDLKHEISKSSAFSLAAPTSALNAKRVVRAMQVRKPVLLEGSPGAGKTSLIAALANLCGARLTRVNLSDQTDLADLFGQDVPLDEPGKFAWRTAPFSRAMQQGDWVLLDEMNLAPQPVLEGLNACLDHRGEAYIPELDRTFEKNKNFTVFAAQNPQAQGGGRKGLPKSFVNRFSVVYIDQLGINDLHAIAATTHPSIDLQIRDNSAKFVEELSRWSSQQHLVGGPFEFNSRDTSRWLDLIAKTGHHPQEFLAMIVTQRLRTDDARLAVDKMFKTYFDEPHVDSINPVRIANDFIIIGKVKVERKSTFLVHSQCRIISRQIPVSRSALECVAQAWPLISVGASGTGKTSIIRLLAGLCGSISREFAMTPDIDSTDLLGEFDQSEFESERQQMWSIISDEVSKTLNKIEDSKLSDAIRLRDMDSVRELLIPEIHPKSLMAISRFLKMDFSKPVFKWVDGMLIRAVEQGEWLVLDNANLCSASVLDRLNSLLERGGSLSINECANPDGSPREIKPHPDFRLFLTVDPKYGELSRAMRNRGVELFLNDEIDQHISDQFGGRISNELSLQFSQPITIAKLADSTPRTWLRSLILDDRTPTSYISMVDNELALFAKSPTLRKHSLEQLQESWYQYRIQEMLCKAEEHAKLINLGAEKIGPKTTLLVVSALHRIKDSIDCEFDLYGFLKMSKDTEIMKDDFYSVLYDMTQVTDTSRVPVYREWLIKFSEQHGINGLAQMVRSTLGKQYDFADGGAGMAAIWKEYGQPHGFATEGDHDRYVSMSSIVDEFDSMVSDIGFEHAESVSNIRLALSESSSIDETLRDAVENFRNSLCFVHSKRNVQSQGIFTALWELLALYYTIKPSPRLLNGIAKLTTFAGLSTGDLRSLVTTGIEKFHVPPIKIPISSVSILLAALELTKQGQARAELKASMDILIDYGKEFTTSMYISKIVNSIGLQTWSELCTVVPTLPRNITKNTLEVAADLLRSYVCPLPMDPAIAQHVWYERYIKLSTDFSEDNACWAKMQELFGSDSTEVETWLHTQKPSKKPVPSIWRPKDSRTALVHRDMLAVAHLVCNVQEKDLTNEEIESILRNSDHLYERSARATGYRDLVAPVSTALSLLQMHLGIKQKHSQSVRPANLWLLDPVITASGHLDIPPQAASMNDLPLLTMRSLRCWPSVSVDISNRIVSDVYQNWTSERLKLEEKQREQSSGVRYIDEEDDEARAEREFKRMFPDYGEIVDIPSRDDTFVSEFVTLYCQLLLNSTCASLSETLSYAAEHMNVASGKEKPAHLPGSLLAIAERLKKEDSQTTRTNEFNFYTDSSSSEMTSSARFAESVLNRALILLERWPEHDTLQTFLRVSKDILELPPSAPVAMHLSKVEQLHHHLYEWNRFASKEVAVNDLMDRASSLIVHWRRLELATWPSLFLLEKKKAAMDAAPFWFHLYETSMVSPANNLSDTAKVLVSFMSESSIGQYKQRLELLKAFEAHSVLYKDSSYDNIYRCLKNIRQYFELFADSVQNHLDELESHLRKKVDEVVKLASWRDVNIHALKQSAQRSHRQLFKYVKNFRELLQKRSVTENLSNIVVNMVQTKTHSVTLSSIDTVSADWVSLAKSSVNFPQWDQLPARMRELGPVSKSLDRYTRDIQIPNITSLYDLASDVEKKALLLRKETPQKWSKETKKEISALKVEKQQLLTFTLRESKRSGLRQTMNKKILADQIELTGVLANSPNLEGTIFASIDSEFFSFIELLPRLRAAVSDALMNETNDVAPNDLQRGLALGEDIFSHILRLRKVAFEHAQTVSDYHESYKSLTELAQAPQIASYKPTTGIITKTAHFINKIIDLIENVTEATNGITANTSGLRTQVTIAATMSALMGRTDFAKRWFAETDDFIMKLDQQVLATKTGPFVHPVLQEVHKGLLYEASGIESFEETISEEVTDTLTTASNSVLLIVQDIVSLIRNVVNNQSNYADNEQSDTDSEDDGSNWSVDSVKSAMKMLASLRSREMTRRFDRAAQNVFRYSQTDPVGASGLAASLMVYMSGYQRLASAVENVYDNLLQSVTTAALRFGNSLLSLATTGFCSPQPMEEDEEDEPAKGDGVGLGDGAAGQSSSKDVDEDDDDVAEAMNTANPDQEQREENEEEDNAKEMEGEMAGEMEDAPPQESETEEDDADNDLDEEVGNLDDLDQNKVDEKMWDDQQPDIDEKEKTTSDTLEGSKQSDDEAEVGNENEQKQEQNQNDDDQEGNEDNKEELAEDEDQQNEELDGENGDKGSVDDETEQKEALNLPDDINLDEDTGEQDNEADESGEEKEGEDTDVEMEDIKEEEEATKADDAPNELENPEENVKSSDSEDESAEHETDTAVDDQKENNEELNEQDENIRDLDTEKANEEGDEGDSRGTDIEGLQGSNDQQDMEVDKDQATTTEVPSESQGQGASQDASMEQSNTALGGTSGANQDLPDQDIDKSEDQQTSRQIEESLKQLGDASQEFHRRQREIREHEDHAMDEDDGKTSDPQKPLEGKEELEHVGAQDAHDTQALGKAEKEFGQEIDQSMAIDDEENLDDKRPEENVAGDHQEDAQHGGGAGDTLAEDEDEQNQDSDMIDDISDHFNRKDSEDDSSSEDESAISNHEIVQKDKLDVSSQRDDLWQVYEAKTHDLAMMLGEQLRSILEPTIASKLRGDYRTGKRLNMKRIIPYIASDFRKDKIWLRRSKPAKREYQILLSLDDSKSMGEPAVVDLAFQAIALVGKASGTIEAGQVGIAKFGSTTEILHPLDLPLTTQNGNAVLSKFSFSQPRTNVSELLTKSLEMFAHYGSNNAEQWKLEIIVSDGITDDHQPLRKLVRKAYDERVMIVFVVLDALNKDTSVLDMNEVRYTTDDQGNPKLEVAKYFEDFPFDYYVIVRNIRDLPMVLANVLRQYFQAQQG